MSYFNKNFWCISWGPGDLLTFNFVSLSLQSSTSKVGHSEVNSQCFFFSKYLKGLSSSLLKTLEKKLHNASALLSSADAAWRFPWLSVYFKSLMVLCLLFLILRRGLLPKVFGVLLACYCNVILMFPFHQSSFVPTFISIFLYCT